MNTTSHDSVVSGHQQAQPPHLGVAQCKDISELLAAHGSLHQLAWLGFSADYSSSKAKIRSMFVNNQQ